MKALITFISFLFSKILFSIFYQKLCSATDTINTTWSIRGNDTLISSGRAFELGFFSPGSSNNWYVGIWYKNITPKTVVWVANREAPLRNSTLGELKVSQAGRLVVLNETNNIIWSSNNSGDAQSPVAQLLDSGNLVLREANNDLPENYLWQSFEHPTDTIIPGMNFRSNSVPGRENYLIPWKTYEDPSPGDFTRMLDSAGYLQMISKRGSDIVYRSGPWNGLFFSGSPNSSDDPTFRVGMYRDKEGIFYYRLDYLDSSVFTRLTVNPTGVGQHWTWEKKRHAWVSQMDYPGGYCDTYGLCGAYGSCNIGKFPLCGCLDGFVPKDPEGWRRAQWSSGCVRRAPLNCASDNIFLMYSDIKLPDARTSWYNESMTLDECKKECMKNCNCTAYTSLDIRNGGSGCLLWLGDLVDIKILSADGQHLYVRMDSSELGSGQERKSSQQNKNSLIVSLTLGGAAMLGLSLLLYNWKRKKNDKEQRKNGRQYDAHNKDLELTLVDSSTILKATDNFSMKNKIGEGGYGPVYKGTLEDGQEIAVKRLSNTSMQGLNEFKNEVVCVAKHQHRNLVKLLGYCTLEEEKMLIYEYMPNKSLDLFLFDELKRASLDWAKRFNIINGIARGLMYLHQDSQLRIIHRDIKASNILLDSEMNPKISDFGIAKRFSGNETEDKTNRVVGTYGYMSPEYAVRGAFSVKSDVFSFGVLLLEIISGKRNNSYSYGDRQLTLLGHAWTLYKEGWSTKLIDSYLNDSNSITEVLHVIHVGLLCVQQCPDDRPTMCSVVSMLRNEFVLPQPNPPGFFTENDNGYMPPEYAVRDSFSVKSDVFSFGVLLLEIVIGKRNSSHFYGDHQLTLLGHVWTLYKEGWPTELIDSYLNDADSITEVLRVTHVSLLCVHQFPNDRPTMSSVVSMLRNEFVLPQPNQPGFFTENDKYVLIRHKTNNNAVA